MRGHSRQFWDSRQLLYRRHAEPAADPMAFKLGVRRWAATSARWARAGGGLRLLGCCQVFGLAGFAFVLAVVTARLSCNIMLKIAGRVLAGEWGEEYSARPVAGGGWTMSASFTNAGR